MELKDLTVKECARRLGLTERGVRKRIYEGLIFKNHLRKIKGNAGQGGINYMIDADYLRTQDLGAYFKYVEEYFLEMNPDLCKADGSNRTEGQIERWKERMRILHDIKRVRLSSPQKQKTEMIKKYTDEHGYAPSTVRTWEKKFRDNGPEGLFDGQGISTVEWPSLHPEVRDFIEREYLRPEQPSAMLVHERLKVFCLQERHYLPCYQTVLNYVTKEISWEMKIRFREGEMTWKKMAVPYIIRDLNDLKPNEVWVGDSRVKDIFVYSNKEKRIVIRPWLILLEDMGPRKFVGWRLCRQPNSVEISLAIRDGVIRNGIPLSFYFDNGKDYRAYYISGARGPRRKSKMNTETEGILMSLHCDIHFALPYNPQSKPIEPAFKIFKPFEQELPGWCGADNKKRPEKLIDEIKKGKLLTFDEFHKKIAEHIEWYNNRTHSALGKSPNKVREGCRFVTVDEKDMDILLTKKKNVRVNRNGITLFKNPYWSDFFVESRQIWIGDRVDIRYDPENLSKIRVYKNERFMCYALLDPKMSAFNASEKDMKKLESRKKKALKRVNAFRQERDILFKPGTAEVVVMEEKTDEIIDTSYDPAKQGPVDPGVQEKRIIKQTVMRAEEEDRDPFSVNTSSFDTDDYPRGRSAPQKPLSFNVRPEPPDGDIEFIDPVPVPPKKSMHDELHELPPPTLLDEDDISWMKNVKKEEDEENFWN